MEFDPGSQNFWNEEDLGAKLRQVYDVCHGCRRCLNLCPSFNVMFDRIDASPSGEVDGLVAADYRRIEDVCYQCKLCYNHCPYTPPHRFDIDFPRLMLRAKAVRARKEGVAIQDRVLGDPDRTGRLAAMAAPLANWVNGLGPARLVMEKTLGVAREFPLPRFVSETFDRWFARRHGAVAKPPSAARARVALFHTCSVNYNTPETGRAAVQVLLRNGIEVHSPKQVCCGMPALDGGDIASFQKNARENLKALAAAVDAGCTIVSPGPTCSYVLKKDYPAMVGGREAEKVAGATQDLCEYLFRLRSEGGLDTSFVKPQGSIAYHLPCHLKSQNIGFRSRDLLSLLPGARVTMVDRCSGVDGTWGMKREYHDMALKVAEPLFEEIRAAAPDRVVTDCPLAGLQIARGTGMRPVHPVEVLRDAYGLQDEETNR
jgi:glycerol-3-phosphate dehydrogenase subunit C